LKPQQVDLASPRPLVAAQLRERDVDGDEPRARFVQGREVDGAVAVEGGALHARSQQ
jgi:hypothetical protein